MVDYAECIPMAFVVMSCFVVCTSLHLPCSSLKLSNLGEGKVIEQSWRECRGREFEVNL